MRNKLLSIEPMAHFTCVNFDKSQVLEYVKKIEDSGIYKKCVNVGKCEFFCERYFTRKDSSFY